MATSGTKLFRRNLDAQITDLEATVLFTGTGGTATYSALQKWAASQQPGVSGYSNAATTNGIASGNGYGGIVSVSWVRDGVYNIALAQPYQALRGVKFTFATKSAANPPSAAACFYGQVAWANTNVTGSGTTPKQIQVLLYNASGVLTNPAATDVLLMEISLIAGNVV